MARLSMPEAHEALYTTASKFLDQAQETCQLSHLETTRQQFRTGELAPSNEAWDLIPDPTNPLLVAPAVEEQRTSFRKLKFTHLEQETKSRFLYIITGEKMPAIDQSVETRLQEENAHKKAKLKQTKNHVADMRAEILDLAKKNAEHHAETARNAAEVAELHKSIEDMELELARIKAAHPPEDRMTIDEANNKLDQQTTELERLTDAISSASTRADDLRADVARTAKEVFRLARDREREEARAAEVRRAREAGGTGTKVHDLSRWYAAMLTTYRSLLGIRAAKAVSASELALEYDTPEGPATLSLVFDDGRLVDAKLDKPLDLSDAITVAVHANDAPGLIAEALVRLRPL